MTRPEQAAEQLAGLAAGAEPGTRLGTKDELRARCGVSVGTFNEALRLLGNSVLAIDDDATSVADAVRIRDALEPLLVEDAVRHRSAGDVEALRQGPVRVRAAADGLDGNEFLRANWALHARMAAVSPSVMLRSFYLSLHSTSSGYTTPRRPRRARSGLTRPAAGTPRWRRLPSKPRAGK